MHAFLVELENKPGALADLSEALGSRGINIENVAGSACGDGGRITIFTSDDAGTREACSSLGLDLREFEVVEATMAHQPGSLGKAARRLAGAGVNIESILPTGMSGGQVTVGFITDDPAKTREILSTVAAGG